AHGELNNLKSFADLVDDQTAAIFVETIQGEGGIHACTPEFLRGLRELCTQKNLLLMVDEVQCGLGRTGTFFAYENSGIQVDAIGMAKGLGGGYPIGAIWVRENAADLFQPGSHGSTFGGTPLACAAALAVLDIIDSEKLLEKVQFNSVAWIGKLQELAKPFSKQLSEVRGRGYLVGLQLTSDPTPYVAALREAGLLVVGAGGNVIRLLPPLTATTEELNQSVEILRSVFATKA
ncbi:MAG TPA: aminotransferase class III-fold pyridoxal phosphate-dependent enzyme, partial [Opitutaceae bacterium]